jgi:nitrogen regulatory protein PII
MVCPEDSVEAILELLAGAARTGKPGDGIVTVHKLDRVIRIRELQGVGDQP